MIRRPLGACALLLVLALAAPVRAGDPAPLRRFAFVVGANHGGPDRPALRYAASDARTFLGVLQRIGGLAAADGALLIDPDRAAFLAGLDRLRSDLAAARGGARKLEVVFYYSGHSDEESLRLTGGAVTYAEVRRGLESLPADVRIAVLDSCASGAFTRLKGGVARAPFLIDAANDMKGTAIMTSSSSDEASQESDRLRGSFFTHALVAGLRGAADATHDGRITLNEAYQYAYGETLARTEKTLGGPQHPNVDIRMSGTGEVVMTDLRASGARLELAADLAGRFAVRDASGNLVLELRKAAGQSMPIGLEPGAFEVLCDADGAVRTARVDLAAGGVERLTPDRLALSARETARARGGEEAAPPVEIPVEGLRVWPWELQVVPEPAGTRAGIHQRLVELFGGRCDYLDGFGLGLGPLFVERDARGLQAALIGTVCGGRADGQAFAYFFTWVGDSARVIQAANGFNYAGGPVHGIQVAGAFNFAGRRLDGLQIAGAFNYAGRAAEGLQAAGAFNFAGDSSTGAQVAGVFNYAETAAGGLQAGAVLNYCGAALAGAQAAGLYNQAGDQSRGLQAGFCNRVGAGSEAFQIGAVNLAGDGGGAQIGLLNLAGDYTGSSLGLLAWNRRTRIGLTVWGDSEVPFNLGLRLRQRRFYSLLAAGRRGSLPAWGADLTTARAAFGWSAPLLEGVALEADAGWTGWRETSPGANAPWFNHQAVEVRMLLRFIPAPVFSVFAGAGLHAPYYLPESGTQNFGAIVPRPLALAGAEFTF